MQNVIATALGGEAVTTTVEGRERYTVNIRYPRDLRSNPQSVMAGLLPIMWSTGTGSEVMQRIAVPMIGGMTSSTMLILVVIPAVYGVIKGWSLPVVPLYQARDRCVEEPGRV